MGIGEGLAADESAVTALWGQCGLTRPWNDPGRDYRLAVENDSSAILVMRDIDAIVAAVMVGFDGHRGWVYYLAVDPDRRREGLGHRMMQAAEEWLRARAVPKIQLMVRDDNAAVIAFYEALGLERQNVAVFGRFLR